MRTIQRSARQVTRWENTLKNAGQTCVQIPMPETASPSRSLSMFFNQGGTSTISIVVVNEWMLYISIAASAIVPEWGSHEWSFKQLLDDFLHMWHFYVYLFVVNLINLLDVDNLARDDCFYTQSLYYIEQLLSSVMKSSASIVT